MNLTVTIVICTDGRFANLVSALQCLGQLDHERFEVCVIAGPTPDGTRAMLENWPHPLKHANIESRNLAMSRNRGIDLASGDVIAFIDDDVLPEAEWLDQIIAGYADDRVGAVGGKVFNHTGLDYQWRFGTTDRLGRADLTWSRAADELNFPYSYSFPHLLGANATFRRKALIEIGGFDEEFDYYLDETDVAARILDAGWLIVQRDDAYVHHKYAASHSRNEARIIQSWYSILKNKLYYGLRHRNGYHNVRDVVAEFERYVEDHRNTCIWAISAGHLTAAHRMAFEDEVERATEEGLRRGLSAECKVMSLERRSASPPAFRSYRAAPRVAGRRRFCFLTQEYPPGTVGGTARYVHEMAVGMAALGHDVHVLTMTVEQSRVDFEDGVWVHRLVPGYAPLHSAKAAAFADAISRDTPLGPVPDGIWRACVTRLAYLDWLNERKRIDCVYSLIWDCEGAAILRDGRFPLVVGLQTTLAFWLDNNPERRADESFMASFARPMLALEAEMLTSCAAIHAISRNILLDIEHRYDVAIAPRASVVPLGFDDLASLARVPPSDHAPGIDKRVLFVGRLEARKGIDVLLSVGPEILRRFPNVRFDIVGNDRLPGPGGRTYRDAFEQSGVPDDLHDRIVFHGDVDGERLRGFYSSCDVFVAPSRYESFGIIFVEAMMFAKPVIGCLVGGIPEVIDDRVTGLLAVPGDADSLSECLTQLLSDADLCARMGNAGRRRYESQFGKAQMVRTVAALMTSVAAAKGAGGEPAASPVDTVEALA